MIGTGLSATPTASESVCPIAFPMPRRQARTAAGRVSDQITQTASPISRIDQNG